MLCWLQVGIFQDPHLDKLEQRELMEWMSLIDEQRAGTILRLPSYPEGRTPDNPIVVPEGQSRLIITQAKNSTDGGQEKEEEEFVYHIRAERDEFVLGIQLLNPFHNYTTEKLFIYDFREVKHSDRIKVSKLQA